MYNLGKLISMGAAIILLAGCANPSFNPNNKQIVFVEGKPFRIPYGASHTGKRFTNTVESREKMTSYKREGLICNIGDLLWIENYTAKTGVKIYKSEGKLSGYTYIGKASREGKSGCVRPISNQEYSFYRSKELEASANARTQANLAAAMTPKTVNVNHSGTVYQNTNVTGTMNHNVRYKPYYGY